MDRAAPRISFQVNGVAESIAATGVERLSSVLREQFGLTGTKIGCEAGDCGACTVLVDGEPVCACLIAVGQVEGASVVTIEGVAKETRSGARLLDAFHETGAAQCGACTPGMIVSAAALLDATSHPGDGEVEAALGGVLCRCTGYVKIFDAVRRAADGAHAPTTDANGHVGARIARLDGRAKVEGRDLFGADGIPEDALFLHAIRSPHHRARFTFGDIEAWRAARPGVERILAAADVPGRNLHGVIPPFADQPVFATEETRFKGEAVAAIVGARTTIEALDLASFPVRWTPLPPALRLDEALAPDAPLLHETRPDNILVQGYIEKGDIESAEAQGDVSVEGGFETGFVEHAYIEPEAGFARRVGDRIEISACTQSPYMDRDDVAAILGIAPQDVRIVPTAVGGGFGSKLDLSVQPYIALAAWLMNRPVAMVYSRPESIATTTKRHPSRIRARISATKDGKLAGVDFAGDFNTGAYASWGPTVANRVPVHASGPYFVPHYRARSRAIHTHCAPSGAFRGFGVPQMAVAQEQLLDELSLRLGVDPLELRILNALAGDQPTATGQLLGDGVAFRQCLEALREPWRAARRAAESFNAGAPGHVRRGVGVAGMWYGCGNTSLPNPSTIRIGLKPDGRIALHQGAVDIGQGSNTVVTQIAASALGVGVEKFDLVSADTDLTPDCGKTSASRQTFVTGRAAEAAGKALRAKMLRLANVSDASQIALEAGGLILHDKGQRHEIALATLRPDARGYVLAAEETFDPPTTPLDDKGQGTPYAVYGFGAHMAEVDVDIRLGAVKVRRIVAAHDVGRAINPTLLEGQIEGGVMQGLGLALMEEFHPGRGENLHDYLIPTIGDTPAIETILIETPNTIGPFGAKGIGEQALIPTAPAIFNAIRHATGVVVRRAPATPDRLLAAIKALA
ncbi:MAG TPA: molybdopterin-dependent oxidoreductase [Rhodoblastus sp.]|nr:molybdopterin-dependent oxidoreductase [Rhodoblastus sp.]